MFFNIVPVIIIIASLIGILILIVRKFPQLISLDVNTLPQVQQAEVKKRLELQRFWRAMERAGAFLRTARAPLKHVWLVCQRTFRVSVARLQARYEKMVFEAEADKDSRQRVSSSASFSTKPSVQSAHSEQVGEWLAKADEHIDRDELKDAERCYIEALKLDDKYVEAYRGLGKVYLDLEKYKEAIAIFKFLLKLAPRDDRALNRLAMAYIGQRKYEEAARALERAVAINDSLAIRFFDLGRLYLDLERPAAALRNFHKAVEIEPGNPKYLDQLLEISIITGDRNLAKEIYARLEGVNPENQKLQDFRARIEEMV